ncbi:MAG: thioredoxin family protein [Polaromonas sp.]|uniref:thioredoxin family protein n=1 Tax=Polaromonas sp. TaxID=1869339 RepID=UPI002489F6DB|nr:thioredoxin family protein [Polaromonas sp.]MDI1269411.1 thioredoxin family protein [Polaromonas sp.]
MIRSTVLFIAVAVAASAAVLTLATAPSAKQNVSQEVRLAPDFQGIDTWLNSEPLSMDGLRGKVVLLDFWTYTCINCLNQLPYVRRWHEKYGHAGLVVVGVHTPEFAFEKSIRNVQGAIKRLQIKHAVAQDNSYATWRAYQNQYWPAIYLIDKQGRIVYSHFGEGRYAEIEMKIEALLAEPASRGL